RASGLPDFGDVHDQDAPRLARIIEGLVRPSRPQADVPSPRLPAADPSPPAPEPGAPSPHTPGAGPPAPPPTPVPAASHPGGWQYNPPPTWPTPPAGWTPPPGWTPDPGWPPAPPGWQFWLPAPAQAAPPAQDRNSTRLNSSHV